MGVFVLDLDKVPWGIGVYIYAGAHEHGGADRLFQASRERPVAECKNDDS